MGDASLNTPPSGSSSNTPEQEGKFGGFTRFEIELEFVQALGNPHYVSHLATLNAPRPASSSISTESTPLLQHPPFVAYLQYLQYFSTPKYIKFLMYPGPTLKMLELLQSERFRREIISPEVVGALIEGGVRAMEKWGKGED